MTNHADLAVDLATDLATDLAVDLGGSPGVAGPVLVSPGVLSAPNDPAEFGDVLSYVPAVWSGATGTVTVTLLRNGVPLPDAPNGYVVLVADADATFRVREIATNLEGGVSASFSNGVDVEPIAATAAPVIAGVAKIGETLTITHATWNGGTGVGQLFRGETPIAGTVDALMYVQVEADIGEMLQYRDVNGAVTSVSNIITTLAPVATVAPVIAGLNSVGDTLTITHATWDSGTGTGQLERDGVPIAGTVDAVMYVQTVDDPGAVLRYRETNAGADALSNSITTRPYWTVAPTVSAINDPVELGDTVTINRGTVIGEVTADPNAWERSTVTIPGETGDTYVIATADYGFNIGAEVSSSNAGGATTALTNTVTVEAAPSTDWRTTYPGAQASFRRLPDNSNVVLATGDTEIQTLTDTIPELEKFFPEAPYVVDAASASQRPQVGAGVDMDFVAANSDAFVKDPSPFAQALAGRIACTMYFDWAPTAANQGGITVAQGNTTYWTAWSSGALATGVLYRRFPDAALTGARPEGDSIDAIVSDAVGLEAYQNGTLDATLANVTAAPAGLVRLALGMLSRNPGEAQYFLNGTLREVLVYFADHDAATVAAITTQLVENNDRRLEVPGAQASFRRLPDDSNVVLAEGDTKVQTLTDVIHPDDKAVNEGPYVLDAPSVTWRPDATADGGIDYDGTELDRLENDAAFGTTPAVVTVYSVTADGNAASQWGIAAGNADYIQNILTRMRSNVGGTTAPDVIAVLSTASPVVMCHRFGVADRAIFNNGVLDVTGVASISAAAMPGFGIGTSYQGNGTPSYGFNGDLREVFVCYADHDDATVAQVTAMLQAYWRTRGVAF